MTRQPMADSGVTPESGVTPGAGVTPDSGVIPGSGVTPRAGVTPDAAHPTTGDIGKTLVVTDLDRTLIYSRAALRLGEATPNLVSVEYHDGGPHSFVTLATMDLLRRLPAGRLVPATTRTVRQYQRITLPGVRPPYAVTSNGGNILTGGAPDPAWRALVAAEVAHGARLSEVQGHLTDFADQDWVRTVRSADGLFSYLVAEHLDFPDGFVDELKDWTGPRGWRVSVQGRKIYAIPNGLTKSAAVHRVRELTGSDRVIAAGDGVLDADVLEYADQGIRPRHGELHDAGWTRPHVEITDHSGVLAGEEIVRWYTAHLTDAEPDAARAAVGRAVHRTPAS